MRIAFQEETNEENQIEKRDSALEDILKFISFLFPIVSTLILISIFHLTGKKKKRNEAIRWMFFGLGFYLAVSILLIIAFIIALEFIPIS